MKKAVLCTLFVLGISCSGDDTVFENDSDLVGTWLLIEQYLDPGDGSGEFMPVDSDKTVTFSANGTYESNGSLCFINPLSNSDVVGAYEINSEADLETLSQENFLVPEDCDFEDTRVYIHFEGNNLILDYLCIEGCSQKYRKL